MRLNAGLICEIKHKAVSLTCALASLKCSLLDSIKQARGEQAQGSHFDFNGTLQRIHENCRHEKFNQ